MPRTTCRSSVAGLMAMLALFAFSVTGVSRAATDSGPLIDLDTSALTPGPIATWKNAGSVGEEFAAGDATAAPTVADVAGRKAVTFGDGRQLMSSFSVPPALVGGKPFTLVVWAYAPQAVKRDVVVSWASRPLNTAEFGYGAGPDGAFFGWDKSARYAKVPAAGQWHQIAYAYAPGELSLYVDGILDARRSVSVSPKPGGRVYLGAGWNGADKKPAFPFHGSLARVQVWDRTLSLREVRNTAGSYEPFYAAPADGATVAAEEAVLRWEAGSAEATSFLVRLAPEGSAVPMSGDGAHRVGKPEFRPTGLVPGSTYTWRVDQLDAAGKVIAPGPAWRFTADNGPATGPTPRDHVAGVRRDTSTLAWTPGRYAASQRVYFGTDRDAVAARSATATEVDAKVGECPLPLKDVAYSTTYYWRVEEQNGKLPAAKGDVWAFRTEDETVAGDITFFVGSDCHYGLGNNAELNRAVIDRMNWLPGTKLPPQAGGGVVRTPRGVVLDGDLLDKGFEMKTAPPAWAEFTKDYGLLGGDGRLAFPLYEGFGNHDGPSGKSVSRAGVRERNTKRQNLTMISANGLHYSWDWDQVHLAQLNLFPGKDSADCIVGPPNHDPEDSLGFLKDDLAKNVVDRSRTVVVFCHYCYTGGMADWWTDAAKDRFFDALKGYRVILIHGHSHGAYFYTWKGLQVIADGATARPEGQTGDFMMIRLTKDRLAAAQRKADGWGITLDVPIPPAAK
jgi:hypothetical protein